MTFFIKIFILDISERGRILKRFVSKYSGESLTIYRRFTFLLDFV